MAKMRLTKEMLWTYFHEPSADQMAKCKLCGVLLSCRYIYNLSRHVKTTHSDLNRDIVNKYCNVFEDGTVECKICHHRQLNRLNNVKMHLRSAHGIEIDIRKPIIIRTDMQPLPYDKEQIDLALKKAKIGTQTSYITQRAKLTFEDEDEDLQMTFATQDKEFRIDIEMDKRKLMYALIGLLVEEELEAHLLFSKHFQTILGPICNSITENDGFLFKVDEEEIERVLSLIENHIRHDFSNELQSRLLSLKIETDLKAAPNTFCVSVQFINDGVIQTRILGLLELQGETALNDEHIKQILYKFNIDSNQIISAFWDNSKQNHYLTIENSEYLNEIKQFELYPDIYVGDVRVERYLGSTAQLCLLDIFKNANIFERFLECRNTVNFISDISNGYYELFAERNLSIPELDSPWKWGSTYKMIKDLYEARDLLKAVKFEKIYQEDDQFHNNEALWSFIEAFCKALNYLQKTIVRCHTQEMHVGDFYAQWLKCKLLTQKLKNDNKQNREISMICSEVLQRIENRSNDLLNQDRVAACIYMDPRFQRTLDSHQKSYAVEYLKALWSRAKLYFVDESTEMEETGQFKNAEDEMLNEFLNHDTQVKVTGTVFINDKIENLKLVFQTVDSNTLIYWLDHKRIEPELYTLSAICFAIPATQIYEKLLYKHIYEFDNYSKLSQFTKENLLFLRLNVQHVKEALDQVELYSDDPPCSITTLNEGDVETFEILTGSENSSESMVLS